MTFKSYKGFFKPKNPSKYKGDPTNIIYRSSWEKQCMIYFDNKTEIYQWQSEELFIPYKHPITGKYHRYYPDFKVWSKTKDGKEDSNEQHVELAQGTGVVIHRCSSKNLNFSR